MHVVSLPMNWRWNNVGNEKLCLIFVNIFVRPVMYNRYIHISSVLTFVDLHTLSSVHSAFEVRPKF